MAQKKKSTQNNKTAKPITKAEVKRKRGLEFTGVGLVALALLVGLCVYAPDAAGIVGPVVNDVIFGILGIAAYVLPPTMALLGVLIIISYTKKTNAGKIATVCLLLISLFSMLHLFFSADLIIDGFSKFVSDAYAMGVEKGVGLGVVGAVLRGHGLRHFRNTESSEPCFLMLYSNAIDGQIADCIAVGEAVYDQNGVYFGVVESLEVLPHSVLLESQGRFYSGEWDPQRLCRLRLRVSSVGSVRDGIFFWEQRTPISIGSTFRLQGTYTELDYKVLEIAPKTP